MLMDMDDNPAMALPNGQVFCRKYIYENAFLILNSKELKELRSHRESQIELSKTEFLNYDLRHAATRQSLRGNSSKVQKDKDNYHKEDDGLVIDDESSLDDDDDVSTNEGSNMSVDEDDDDEDDDGGEYDNDSIVTFTSEAGSSRNLKTSATSTSDYYDTASKLTFFSRWNTPSSLMFTCPITGVDYPLLAIRPVFIT